MHPSSYPINIPIVSAIIQRENRGQKEILLQTRRKPGISEYSGMREIPAGRIEQYENVYDALKREVAEETGATIVNVISDSRTQAIGFHNDSAFAFQPYCCQQQLQGGLQWIGFVFLCEVADSPLKAQKGETKNPERIAVEALANMIQQTPEKFFTLQLPVLQFYINNQSI